MNETPLTKSDIESFQDLARQFTKNSIRPMMDGDFSDGNPEMVPSIIESAFETGLASIPDITNSGKQYGVWGSMTDVSGTASSIVILSTIAETCGAIAMGLNAQGVASNILSHLSHNLPYTPVKTALGLQEGIYPPSYGLIKSPEKWTPDYITTTAELKHGEYKLTGKKDFLYVIDTPDTFVIFAIVDSKWGCFVIPADIPGIKIIKTGQRTGIRACKVMGIELNDVKIPSDFRIDSDNAEDLLLKGLGFYWYGIAAIAAGIARGSLSAAKEYCAERYQGGTIIKKHSAIKMLIAEAESKTTVIEQSLKEIDNAGFNTPQFLKKAAIAKLTATQLCSQAVTDCLQTFGGYGYIEDFGMEKRLRDSAVLKSTCGPPHYLKQFVFDIDQGE